MKPTKMRIEYCKQIDSETAPWLSLTNVDELQWNGVYSLRVSNDDGSHNLPFRLRDGETVTLVVKDHSHPGKLQGNRTVVQEITHVDRATGCVSNYSRFCSKVNGKPTWSNWTSDEKNVITWNQESHIDMFTTAGIYNIIGERTNAGDGLPFANSNPGHTFHARLVVLDSSINGTEVCITQILMLSNRVGGDGNVYLRTGNAASKEELQSGNSWDLWGTLQQNIEVGQTTSLDDYIDNGVYSGVYMVSPTQLETFVMVVINNYAVAAAMGEVRNISQFKYALNINGNFSYKTRTGCGEDEMDWGSWVDLGAASTTDIQDGAITAQKLSVDVRKKVENPLRPLFIAAGAEYNDTGADITKIAPWGETVTHKNGHYYLNGLGDITEEQMMYIYNYKDAIKYLPKREGYRNTLVRTYFTPCEVSGQKEPQYTHSAFVNNFNLETVIWTSLNTDINTLNISYMYNSQGAHSMFYGCKKLKLIYPMNVKSAATMEISNFNGCSSLVEVRLFNLMLNTGFKDSPDISKQSILYIVNNAAPISAITITLHPDAYARLANDAEIVAALEAQPLVSLVSA
jgi:hypothetical protein